MGTPAKKLTLRATKGPNQTIAPVDYDQRFQDQFSNVLRLYFTELDNFTAGVSQVITADGIVFPDGTLQTTAWEPCYIEAYDRTSSIALATTPTLLKPASFLPPVSEGITYDATTGEFTFQYEGVYSLGISLNIKANNNNQVAYVYAQKNVGAGWVNNTNSGKAYKLTNNVDVQFVNAQSVYRAAGEKTRYYIYASALGPTLVTTTLPTVTPTVYVPAIRIQYAGG